jgi:hypothetical protein
MDTPFSFGKIVSGQEFTDREKEDHWLQQQWAAGNNCMIISPRRWGKSSLVLHAGTRAQRKKRETVFCFIDLYNIRTEQEFYEVYAKEVLKAAAGSLEEMAKSIRIFFRQLLPKLSFSPDPATDISIAFDWKEVKKDPSEILELPEKIAAAKKKKIIVCIDEFQNLSFFDNPLALQKKLRAHWQRHHKAVYCLYGSKRHMLMDFFTRPYMPFYQFGEILFLEKIPAEYWVQFITSRFQDTGKSISPKQAGSIARQMDNHPYFVQHLSQAVWLRTNRKCQDEIIDNAIEELLDQYTILYQKEVDQLTNSQLNFLRALCAGAEKLSSAETIQQYKLGTSANILRIKAALEAREMIDITGKKVSINDPMFECWLKKRFFRF